MIENRIDANIPIFFDQVLFFFPKREREIQRNSSWLLMSMCDEKTCTLRTRHTHKHTHERRKYSSVRCRCRKMVVWLVVPHAKTVPPLSFINHSNIRSNRPTLYVVPQSHSHRANRIAYRTLASRVCSLFFSDVRYLLHRMYDDMTAYTMVAWRRIGRKHLYFTKKKVSAEEDAFNVHMNSYCQCLWIYINKQLICKFAKWLIAFDAFFFI